MPRWNTISISGYHIREAGSTAAQELAFTLADGMAYVEAGIEAGMDVDEFAPRLSFFFNAAHATSSRRSPSTAPPAGSGRASCSERFGAAKRTPAMLQVPHPDRRLLRSTAQQPENNIVRTAYEALAAVLGGTQSLHTNSMDEALAPAQREGGGDRARGPSR